MSDNLNLGKLIDSAAAQRDAIHIAVAPVIANERLTPGQHVGFVGDDSRRVGPSANPIGVVDPFIKYPEVFEGERFWLFLYPGTITSLRHEWTHPAFRPSPSESEAWLRVFAEDFRMSYGALLEAAEEWIRDGEMHCLGFDTPERAYRDADEFWKHWRIVTGKDVPANRAENFFTCSC